MTSEEKCDSANNVDVVVWKNTSVLNRNDLSGPVQEAIRCMNILIEKAKTKGNTECDDLVQTFERKKLDYVFFLLNSTNTKKNIDREEHKNIFWARWSSRAKSRFVSEEEIKKRRKNNQNGAVISMNVEKGYFVKESVTEKLARKKKDTFLLLSEKEKENLVLFILEELEKYKTGYNSFDVIFKEDSDWTQRWRQQQTLSLTNEKRSFYRRIINTKYFDVRLSLSAQDRSSPEEKFSARKQKICQTEYSLQIVALRLQNTLKKMKKTSLGVQRTFNGAKRNKVVENIDAFGVEASTWAHKIDAAHKELSIVLAQIDKRRMELQEEQREIEKMWPLVKEESVSEQK